MHSDYIYNCVFNQLGPFKVQALSRFLAYPFVEFLEMCAFISFWKPSLFLSNYSVSIYCKDLSGMNCNLWAGLWRFFLVEWPSFVVVQGALVASLFTTWALNSQGKPIVRISENVVYICGQPDFQNQSDLLYQVTSIPGKPQVSGKRVG